MAGAHYHVSSRLSAGIARKESKIKSDDVKLGVFLLILLAVDIVTKYIVQNCMLLHQTVSILPNFFNITYVENPGAAFGILANVADPWRNVILGIVSGLAIIMLLVFYRQYADNNLKVKFALVLVLGGAVGNIIDRIRFGVVIDFIDVHWYEYHWPAFNVADSAICVGVGILFWQLWFDPNTAED